MVFVVRDISMQPSLIVAGRRTNQVAGVCALITPDLTCQISLDDAVAYPNNIGLKPPKRAHFYFFFSSLDQRPHLVVYLGELKAKQRLGNSDSHLAQDALAYPSRTTLGATSGRTRIYDFSLVWLWAWFRNLRSGENGPGVPTIGGSGHAMPCQLMPCHGVPSRNNVTGT
jgi:hypothetical protein